MSDNVRADFHLRLTPEQVDALSDERLFRAPYAVFVVGPTASGKSEFAFRLAKQLDGVVISADSMQIYRGLDVGTAKEPESRRKEVVHEMIDIVNADEEFSVALYAEQARQCVRRALKSGKLPIIAGGTGLYVEALLYPMQYGSSDKNPELRAQLENEYAEKGGETMLKKLAELDSETAARLFPNDRKRVIRALEIVLTTGKPMSAQKDARPEAENDDVIMVAFGAADRSVLYNRINARVDEMVANGLVEEVAAVGNFGYQSMQAIGYKEFAGCNFRKGNGKTVFDESELSVVVEKIKKDTRNYAKRQLTWFRRYGFARWFEAGDFENAAEYVKSRLNCH